MTFKNSQQSRAYIDTLAAACYARNVAANSNTTMHDVTVLCDEERNFIPGSDDSGFSLDGPLDTDGSADAQAAIMSGLKGASSPTPITYMPLGTDGAAWLVEADSTDFTVSTDVGSTADWSMTAQTTGMTDFAGQILENNTSVTTDTDGSNLDNGAATSNGGVAHLHVTAYSGLTSDDIIIEGSATGSFGGEETTIATFTQVTGTTSERVVVTGSVPRYLRVVDDVTGTGSITRLVAFARR